MDKTTLGTLIKQQVADAKSDDAVAKSNKKSLEYYRGDLFGDEDPEQSKYVSRDLAETVDSLLPALMRVFYSGDQFGKFEPTGPEDEEGAKQASDLCNQQFEQADGFMVGQFAMKDSLLQKTGLVEVGWDDTPKVTKENYRGLTDQELAVLEADENIEVSEKSTRKLVLPGPDGQPIEVPAHDVTIRKTNLMGSCAVFNVPPEEFFVQKGATNLKTALICGRQYLQTASELREQGFSDDDIEEAGNADDAENDQTGKKQARWGDEQFEKTGELIDPSTRQILRTDAYMRVDWDDDGIAELRKVTCLGNGFQVCFAKPKEGKKPTEPEEIDIFPFAVFQGIPSPHKFHGESMYDKIGDLQFLNSTLVRQTLDNLYLTNQPRVFAKGDVDIEALLTVRPNGVVQGGINSALEPLAIPFMAKETFAMIEFTKGAREERSGVTRYNQGLDADSLNKTATGVQIIQSAAEQKQELIARNFAEGFRQVYKLILKNICQHYAKPLAVRVRNKWVQMDPRAWKDNWDFTVSVGLGTGNKTQRAQQAMLLLQVQKELVAGGKPHLATDKNVFNGTIELARALDMKPQESFFTDPDQNPQPAQPPPQDPLMVEVQLRHQRDSAKDQMDHQYRMTQLEKEHAVKMRQAELDAAVKGYKATEDIKTDRIKVAGEQQLKRDVATDDADLKFRVEDHGARLKGAVAEHDATLRKDGHETDKAIKKEGAAVKNDIATEKAMGKHEETIAAAMAAIAAALEKLNSPRKIVRDKDNRVSGVE